MPGELLALGGLALALALFALAAERPGSGRADEGARWAKRADLTVLSRRSTGERSADGAGRPAGRLALGFHGRRLLRAEHRHALVAFGPPQSGKSAGLAIPALLEWQGPAVASSIKTDLLGATLKRRQQLGQTFVFDPFELSGVPGQTWSPLRRAATWDGALEVAWRLAAADRKSVV